MTRPTASQRGYDSRWQKYRERYLGEHPFCVFCLRRGKHVRAKVVDHIEPHRGDHRKFWNPSNHQSLCKTCHDSHKQRFEKSGVVAGCDASGMPMDPNHPWFRG